MRRIRYQVACSLDGYIAGPNGEYDWIVMDPEIDFGAFMSSFDTVLVGRRTFEAAQANSPGMAVVCWSSSPSVPSTAMLAPALIGGNAFVADSIEMQRDQFLRPDTTMEGLASLTPSFTALGATRVPDSDETLDQLLNGNPLAALGLAQ